MPGRSGRQATTEQKEPTITPRIDRAQAADMRSLIEESLGDDKAQDVVVIDLTGKSTLADYLVIASGTSQRHVGAMAEHLHEKLKKLGVKGVSLEGVPQCDWVLLDAGDVIVHLFRPEVRDFYSLEKMWGPPPGQAADQAAQEATA